MAICLFLLVKYHFIILTRICITLKIWTKWTKPSKQITYFANSDTWVQGVPWFANKKNKKSGVFTPYLTVLSTFVLSRYLETSWGYPHKRRPVTPILKHMLSWLGPWSQCVFSAGFQSQKLLWRALVQRLQFTFAKNLVSSFWGLCVLKCCIVEYI